MTDEEILACVDHTLLKATASWAEIDALCAEAIRYKTASACVPPSYVRRIRNAYPGLNICTVIGFPLGYNVMMTKLFEAQMAITEGANELDIVVNIGDVKNGAFGNIAGEIGFLKRMMEKKILKVIVETCCLTAEEKIRLCHVVTDAGADYIKTSTGFGAAGATLEDVLLFKDHIGPGVKIKAAGGIKTREEMEMYLGAGCERIGTSHAVKVLTGGDAIGY